MDTADQIWKTDAVGLVDQVRQRKLSPVEILDAVESRFEAVEPTIHAFSAPDFDNARRKAEDLADRISRGEDVGRLAGVPLGIKDLVAAEGLPLIGGSKAYVDFIAGEDDVCVERLRAQDAIILGKTNVPEFGYSGVGHNPVLPTTRNPWNPDRTSGGSSAGSGAAVAAGVGPVAIAADGGGSIRIPAAHCGLFGMKAAYGRVPLFPANRDYRYPGLNSWEYLEHVGPVSRTVADSALVYSVIAGPDARDRHSIPDDVDWMGALERTVAGRKVAYSRDFGYVAVDERVRAIVDEAVLVFADDLGCEVIEADPGIRDPYDEFWGLVAVDTDLRAMREMADRLGGAMSPHIRAFLARPWTAEDLTDALTVRKEVCQKMAAFMAGFDLLVTPTLTVPPFGLHTQGPDRVGDRMVDPVKWLSFTLLFNLTGQPAATVPAGWTEDDLPVGLQIVGPHLGEEAVLSAAAQYEQARPWRDRWPRLGRDG